MEDEELNPNEAEPDNDMDDMGAPMAEGGEKFSPNASEGVRAAVQKLRDAMDDEEFDPVIEGMITNAAPGALSKAIAAVLALLFTGVGQGLGVDGAEVVDVMEHIAADLVEFAQKAGVDEAQDDAIAEQVMRDAVGMIEKSGIAEQGADMQEPDDAAGAVEAPTAQPRNGFARRIPMEA